MAIQAGLLNKTEIAYAYEKMLANVAAAGGKTTLGLALYPPYPKGSFSYGMEPYEYQNAGDWAWFGGRIVQVRSPKLTVAGSHSSLHTNRYRVLAGACNERFRLRSARSTQANGAAGLREQGLSRVVSLSHSLSLSVCV